MKFLDRFKRKPKPEDPVPPPETKAQVAAANVPKPDGKPSPSQPAQPPAARNSPAANELRLELGDFLHRIPAQMLLPGPHDL